MLNQPVQIGIRITEDMRKAIDKDMKRKNYATYSEYVREAIREKLGDSKQ